MMMIDETPCVLCPVSSLFLTHDPEMNPSVTFTVLFLLQMVLKEVKCTVYDV